MLAKCANPGCSHVFRYFGTGKIFRLRHKSGGRGGTTEHFWLCAECAPVKTLAIEPDGKPVVIPRALVGAYREAVGRVARVPEIDPAILQAVLATCNTAMEHHV